MRCAFLIAVLAAATLLGSAIVRGAETGSEGQPIADVAQVYLELAGTITSAKLIYNGPVATDSATWGAVKAIYR